MADLKTEFATAAQEVQKLKSRPSNDQLLELYALYKQASEGDVKGSRPGFLDLTGRAKYDAWAAKKGTSADKAMQAYVAVVEKLRKRSEDRVLPSRSSFLERRKYVPVGSVENIPVFGGPGKSFGRKAP